MLLQKLRGLLLRLVLTEALHLVILVYLEHVVVVELRRSTLVSDLNWHPNRVFKGGRLVLFGSRRSHLWVVRRLRIVKFYHCIDLLQLIALERHYFYLQSLCEVSTLIMGERSSPEQPMLQTCITRTILA